MKRRLSLLLALVMMIGVFSPIASAASGKSEGEKLFDQLESKLGGVKNIDLGLISIYTKIQNVAGNISKELYNEHNYFKERKIEQDEITNLIENSLYEDMIKLVLRIKNGANFSTEKTNIEKMMNDFYESLPGITQASIDQYAADKGEKTEIITNIANYMMGQKFGVANYRNGEFTSLQLRLSNRHKEEINKRISKNANEPLTSAEVNLVNALGVKTIGVLNGAEEKALAEILVDMKMIDKNETTSTSGGGSSSSGGSSGGGGGGGGGAPAPSKDKDSTVDVPKDKEDRATVSLDKKDIKTTLSAAGKTSVKLDEKKAMDAVKELRKEAGSTREASLVINLDNVSNLKFEVELSDKLIKELSDSKVSLEINSKNSKVEIPVETLKGIKIPAGSTLEFKMDELSNDLVQDKLSENKNAKKVLDLALLVTGDGKSEEVKDFKETINITLDVKGLGDSDKLAVYYLNEEDNTFEFVAGKVKDNKMVLKLSHFSKYVVVESDITFEDIKGHWGQKYIESMAAKEIVSGYEDGSFKPDEKVTRAEFSKMIVEAMELELKDYNGEFTDVDSNDWYGKYVATMLENKIAVGYEDKTFKPNAKITRAEMAVIVGNVLDEKLTQNEVESLLDTFKDNNEIKDWAEVGVAKAAKAGIMIGDNDKFNPNNNTSRAEVATAVYRLYNR